MEIGALGKPSSLAGKNNSRKSLKNLVGLFHNYHQELRKSLIVFKSDSLWFGIDDENAREEGR